MSRRQYLRTFAASATAAVVLTNASLHAAHVEAPAPAELAHFDQSLQSWVDEVSDLLRDMRQVVVTGALDVPPGPTTAFRVE
jgi:hypothetical protein